jgi:hypothetical protein
MNHASCLCGTVTWEIDGPFEFMSHCHCSRCRKAHGVAFATYVGAPASGFRLHGAENVTRWESSPGLVRCFCQHCGSVVPGDPADGLVFAPAGNFDDDPGARPMLHIFVGSKAPWDAIGDRLPQFEAYPPGIDAPVVADRAPLDPPGAVRGSCLCGAVTYAVDGQPQGWWNCHCGRCRKARSAAHASNLFLPADGLRFTRGVDAMAAYKLPSALRFTQAFCRTCGSSLPFVNRARNIAVIPAGSLDDDPGLRPQAHIFVGSKAPWFDIADNLPQHAEYPG